METRCVLPSMRNIAAPADCTCPQLGSGRNRYVRLVLSGTAERPLFRIVRRKLLYVTHPKLLCPFVEFHKAIFWVGGWNPDSLPRFSNLLPSHYKLLRDANNITGADASAVSLYVAEHPSFLIVRRKPLYAGSTEDQRNAAPPHNPVRRSFAERQAGLFTSSTPRLNVCNCIKIPATNLAIHLGQGPMGPPPHNPVRRSCRRVAETLEYDFAAQNNNPRLSAAANKFCLKGRPYKIWSCCPAPDGYGQPVCAASLAGRVLRPAPGAVSALNSSLSEVASLCSIGTAPFFKAIPPHANLQNGTRIDEQCKTP